MIEYTIDEPSRLILVRMRGSNSCADLERHYAEVYRDPRYDPALKSIFHVEDDAGGPILTEFPQVKMVMELAAQAPDALKQWAVVVPSPFKRTMIAFMLRDLDLGALQLRVFPTQAAAIAWLRPE